MRIIALKTLRQFWNRYPQAQQPLQTWYADAKKATWNTPSDIKSVYRNASILADHRVAFDVKGNDFRLVVKINYQYGIVYIRFVGTHAEYDRIDATSI